VAVDLIRLWDVPVADAVQPRAVGPMTGLDENLLYLYRCLPSRAVGGRVLPLMTQALTGSAPDHQLACMAGVVLWEREFEQVADSARI
jgi:hypothetical protein